MTITSDELERLGIPESQSGAELRLHETVEQQREGRERLIAQRHLELQAQHQESGLHEAVAAKAAARRLAGAGLRDEPFKNVLDAEYAQDELIRTGYPENDIAGVDYGDPEVRHEVTEGWTDHHFVPVEPPF